MVIFLSKVNILELCENIQETTHQETEQKHFEDIGFISESRHLKKFCQVQVFIFVLNLVVLAKMFTRLIRYNANHDFKVRNQHFSKHFVVH